MGDDATESSDRRPAANAQEITIEARGLRFPALSLGKGPLVLCLHGFPDCLRSFRHTLPALAQAGYRAVAPALRGYHPDCLAPDGDYHALQAAEDAGAIVRALGEERAHLVGHDWGACCAYLAARLEPARWYSVTTIAVPDPAGIPRALWRHPEQLLSSWYMFFFQLPGVAERALLRADFALVERLWRDWSPGWAPEPEELDAVKRALGRPGVIEAALAYYRALFRPAPHQRRRTFALLRQPIDLPLLAFTGRRDGCIRSALYEHTMNGARNGRVERFADCGHFLHQEDPERFNALLLGFLRAAEAA